MIPRASQGDFTKKRYVISHTHTHIYIPTHTDIHTHTYTHRHTRTYINTDIHTHTHTHTRRREKFVTLHTHLFFTSLTHVEYVYDDNHIQTNRYTYT